MHTCCIKVTKRHIHSEMLLMADILEELAKWEANLRCSLGEDCSYSVLADVVIATLFNLS